MPPSRGLGQEESFLPVHGLSFTELHEGFSVATGSDIFRFSYLLRGGYLILPKAVFSTDAYLGFIQGEFSASPVFMKSRPLPPAPNFLSERATAAG